MQDGSLLRHVLEVWDGGADGFTALEAELARPAPADPSHAVASLAGIVEQEMAELRGLRDRRAPLPAAVANRLAQQLGWLIRTLRDWNPARNRDVRRLEAALVAAHWWDADGDLWALLQPLLPEDGLLPVAMLDVLRSRSADYHLPPAAPVWEREHLQALLQADAARDWARLLHLARAFPAPVLDPGAAQAARALWALDPTCLVALADNAAAWTRGGLAVGSLSLASAFTLAERTTSGHVRFAALERATHRERRMLSDEEEDALEGLLAALARDEGTWPDWLAAFNGEPARFPFLQRALGRALARSAESAVRAYTDSVVLSTPAAAGGAQVATCLAEFRVRAPRDLRHELWRRAYERWDDWDFGVAAGQDLATAGRSELDYAVVGWLVEFAEPGTARVGADAFGPGLRVLDTEWHETAVSMQSAFNRLLSRHQVFAHAASLATGTPDWLPDSTLNIPGALASPYVAARHPVMAAPVRL